ncbi:cytochrome P450 [Methylocystis sp. JAN1]|uniref:cytochrome P450 n=1 Tax=Methylocystis sp. JAN1 TaxID=3397211 RepID=UPI003FA1EBE6
MFHDPDFMPFVPRKRPSIRVAARNFIENWPAEAYRDSHATVRGVWPILPEMRLVADPVLVEEILVAQADKFGRDRLQVEALADEVNRDSLFFAEGAHWRWQRRSATPAFRYENLLALVPTFAMGADILAQEWGARGREVVDVSPAMTRATFWIILQAVLGEGAASLDREKYLAALTPAFSTTAWRFLYAQMSLPRAFPFPGKRKAEADVRWLQRETSRLVAERRAARGGGTDILGLLLSARDPETGRAMTDSELVSNLYIFMVAGHETAATALAWTLWLLAKDQATQERLRAEIDAVVGARDIAPEDLEHLMFARQVIQESMRLFPPGVAIGRGAREDVTIGPLDIRKGDFLLVASFCLHRHEKLWEEPNAFDPCRFAPQKASARQRYAYLPFGAGPRICIGLSFAMIEMQVVLATLIRRFRFRAVPGHRLALATNLTLRAKNGLPLEIETL